MHLRCLLFVGIAAFASTLKSAVPAPLWYYDGAHRYLKLVLADFGKTYVEVRTLGAPGESSIWKADGDRKEKEIIFARSIGEDDVRGTFYSATYSEASFKVKIKPGQEKTMQDEGIVGTYHRLTDDKRLSLTKREFEAADKRLNEAYKLVFKTISDADRAPMNGLKQRWPQLRERIASLTDKPKSQTPEKQPIGGAMNKNSPDAIDQQADRIILQSSLTAMQINFVSVKPESKIKEGWEGDYTDGFGGTANILQEAEGKIRLNLNFTRGSEDQNGTISGVTLGKSEGKELTADFVDRNQEVKNPAEQTKIKLRRVGHYLFISTTNAERYTGKGWFDGIYRKQPPVEIPQ